jgi:EpsI family protein
LLKFLNSTPARVVTVFLVLQMVLLYSAIRPETVPPSRPLAQVPAMLGPWELSSEGVVEKEVLDVLQADDLLNRVYRSGNREAGLFVAAFRSQRTGKTPHSPKNCLPGSGWTPMPNSGEVPLDVGGPAPITVNRYIISKGNDYSLVLYWYQSRDRVVASEFKAKFWVMADAIRLNRTDTALVRVLVPIVNRDEQTAERTATDFVRSFYSNLLQYLPA